jgi:spermidine synthase
MKAVKRETDACYDCHNEDGSLVFSDVLLEDLQRFRRTPEEIAEYLRKDHKFLTNVSEYLSEWASRAYVSKQVDSNDDVPAASLTTEDYCAIIRKLCGR